MVLFSETNGIDHINFFDSINRYCSIVHKDASLKPFLNDYIKIYGKDILEDDQSLYFLFPDKCHPNALGQKILAMEIENFFNSSLLNLPVNKHDQIGNHNTSISN